MKVAGLAAAGALGLAGAVTLGTARGDDAKVTFEVHDPATRRPLVYGEESVKRDGADVLKQTIYKTPKNEVGQNEATRFAADTLRLESYQYEDKLSGEMAAVTVKDGRAHVEYRSAKDASLKQDDIEWGPQALSGKALPEAFQKEWGKLLSGSALDFDLYVPFRLETIPFRAVRKDASASAVTIQVEPRNWMIRQLAPTLEFTFDLSEGTPRLVTYRGPSIVAIDGESNKKVEIYFK